MLRRITPSIARSARSLSTTTPKQAPKPVASTSNVLFNLDAKKVGHEIRKRGLVSATGGMGAGMDRVSTFAVNPQQTCLS